MKTILSADNPFKGGVRLEHAFVWQYLHNCSSKFEKILDYGSYNGNLLRELSKSNLLKEGIGVDLNKEAVEKFSGTMPANVQLVNIEKTNVIPFPDNYFDCITFIGVLEHIYRQDLILSELNRVLRPGGVIFVSVPGQHFLSFLDLGNWKFRFPGIHRFYIEARYGNQFYYERYIECKNGLIGDIEVEKKWHEHFKISYLKELLLQYGFHVINEDGFGLYFRLIHNLHYLSPILKKPLFKLMTADMKKYDKAEIFVVAEKI
jgi:SAM-dependent methyltransferase